MATKNSERVGSSYANKKQIMYVCSFGIEKKMIDEFLSITQKFSVDSKIARHAAVIGRTRKTKLPDLLIAATALEWNIPLMTKNLRDFRNIPNLILKTDLN